MKTTTYCFSNKWILLMIFQSVFTRYVFSQEVPEIQYDYSQVGTTSYSDAYVYDDGYEVAKVIKMDEVVLNMNTLLGINELAIGTDYEIQYGVLNPSQKSGVFLTIASVCSCIVLDWEKNPIPPGQTGFIKIKYTARIPGPSEKRFSVYLFDGKGLKPMAIANINITALAAQIQDSK